MKRHATDEQRATSDSSTDVGDGPSAKMHRQTSGRAADGAWHLYPERTNGTCQLERRPVASVKSHNLPKVPQVLANNREVIVRVNDRAKTTLLRFLKEAKQDVAWSFEYYGTEQEARAQVHRMRVELSRLRQLVREHYKQTPVPFRMLVVKLDERNVQDADGTVTVTTVYLQKTGAEFKLMRELTRIFDEISI